MKSPLFSRTIVVPLILLIACQAQTSSMIPAPAATATITPSPTPTPDPEIIAPENASQLVLKFINMGMAQGIPQFSPDGRWRFQETTVGTFAFDTDSYQDVHLLASAPTERLLPDAQTFTGLEALSGIVVYEQSIFSADRSLIAGYFRSDLTTVWRLTDGKLINQFDGQPKEISPDNRLITSERRVSYETYTEYYWDLYDLQSGEQLGSWGGRHAFFLSNNQLVVEASDGYTRIFDPVTRKAPHAFAGWYASFSPDEQNVAVLYGNQIHIYQVSDGKLLRNFDRGLPSTDAANLCFSGNGKILAGFTTEYYCCAGYSNRLFVWQISDGQKIIVLDTYGKVHLYPVDGGMPSIPQDAVWETYLPFLQPASGTSSGDTTEVLSPDGRILALGLTNGTVELWDTKNDQKVYTLLPPTDDDSHSVGGLAFSPDGKLLAVGLLDGTVRLYGLNTR